MSEEEGRFTIHLEQLDDCCVVSSSTRQGIPIHVQVTDGQGQVLHSSE